MIYFPDACSALTYGRPYAWTAFWHIPNASKDERRQIANSSCCPIRMCHSSLPRLPPSSGLPLGCGRGPHGQGRARNLKRYGRLASPMIDKRLATPTGSFVDF